MLPEIRTRRLILRRFREADLPSVLEVQADPAAHPFDEAPAPGAARMLFSLWQRHWAEHGFGYVAVVEIATGKLIGLGGVQVKDLHGEPVLNLYYRFRPSAWGKGYAPEMALPIVEWAEREIPGRPVVIVTNSRNTPAQRVAEKLGFRKWKDDLYEGVPAAYYRRG
ncbi:RimJ/RimL family protein N-acetyltransferase [Prauserella shujinwangii]|uniref:RimJ/RimL family protein N-acetyltransferase n=1 Tax=Prauserella shujinwangii TaxID=1453103 RepID=A0A2T0LYQ0_9PSEU|nr:RimJ/RimL family protein N-acetyltransferase [Prauserella shujinwangii]